MFCAVCAFYVRVYVCLITFRELSGPLRKIAVHSDHFMFSLYPYAIVNFRFLVIWRSTSVLITPVPDHYLLEPRYEKTGFLPLLK